MRWFRFTQSKQRKAFGLYDQAQARIAAESWPEALRLLDRALELDPQYLDALIDRGNVFWQLGDSSRARQDYEAALRVSPQSPDALGARGLLLEHEGDVAGAARDYRAAILVSDGNWKHRHLAEEQLRGLGESLPPHPASLAAPDSRLRQLLFADFDLETLLEGAGEPRSPFSEILDRRRRGDTVGAIDSLRQVANDPAAEVRYILLAWRELRTLGQKPSQNEAEDVLGVVLEVPIREGVDSLAAYADGSARYINHSGSMLLWDAKEEMEIRSLVEALLAEGQASLGSSRLVMERVRADPADVRATLLTCGGCHVLEGAGAHALAAAGTPLMVALIGKVSRPDVKP